MADISSSAGPAVPLTHIGVGLDTARYGHHANFFGEDRRTVAPDFAFPESRAGYDQFAAALERLARRHGNVHFHIRLDAAGKYAVNLEAFLRRLPYSKTVSVGEPKRNKDYRSAHFPKRKADSVDSLACARFAVVERPPETPATPPEFLQLRELAGALQAQRKQTTRHVNQLHNHLARVFPELALLAPGLDAAWVLAVLDKYPTPQRVAAARRATLASIPHVTPERAEKLQAAAQTTTASLQGELAEALIRQVAAEVRHSRQAEERLLDLIERAFDALPDGGHRQLLTIPGIGKRTAAALVAKIVSIDRFPTPGKLVSYFGCFPEENTSGVDKRGLPVSPGTTQMSRKGNDLVRGLLWMACQSALKWNPAIRALYARQRAAGKRGDVALGHCARKMLHLVFAVWKTNRPFDPRHFPWEPRQDASGELPTAPTEPSPRAAEPAVDTTPAVETPLAVARQDIRAQQDAAGHNKGQDPDQAVVTAASIPLATRSVPQPPTPGNAPCPHGSPKPHVDFAALRRQVSLTDALREAGVLSRLVGRGPQRRGPCPLHETERTSGRTFSVNLEKSVFRCLDPACAAQGNVLDFWAALHKLPLRDAALHLAATFSISPCTNQPHPLNNAPVRPS